jgi:uncharacterized protein YcbX
MGNRGALAALWRYPVKSMRGEPLKVATLSQRGIGGDRVFAIRDAETEKVASAKRPRLWGDLLFCQATLASEPYSGAVTITLPDNHRVMAGEDEADAALSALLKRRVNLISQAPNSVEIDRYWPDIAGLEARAMVTSGAIGAGAPGTFFDFAPLHLVTTTTLRQLRAVYPEGDALAARFRPNLVIATSDDLTGWVENAWVGRTLLVGGEARLRVISPTPRCVVPTLPQPGIPHDLGVLRAIVAHNRPPIPPLDGKTQPSLGVYAIVETPGVIHAGDSVRLATDE